VATELKAFWATPKEITPGIMRLICGQYTCIDTQGLAMARATAWL